MAESLVATYGGIYKVQIHTLVSVLAARHPPWAPGGRRVSPSRPAPALVGTNTPDACWYCHKVGHGQREGHTRVLHKRESGKDRASVAARSSSQDDTIHLMALAGSSDTSCHQTVRAVTVDPGATATVVSADWATRFVSSLTPTDRITVVESATRARMKIGTGDAVQGMTELVLRLHLGA